jgi:uncharacterized protein YggE
VNLNGAKIPIVLAILSCTPVLSAQTPAPQPPVIVTRGDATVKRAPDQAWVMFAAEARAPKSGEAQRKAADAMAALQSALKSAGLPADAIKTTSYSLQPDMEYSGGGARLKGYIVNNQIEARVDNLDKISAILDAAGASGATSISGLRFDLKDRSGVEREALQLAVKDAVARAEAIAAGAGRGVGQIVRIDEQRMSGPIDVIRPMMEQRAAGVAATPVTPGETEVRASVTLTIAIR